MFKHVILGALALFSLGIASASAQSVCPLNAAADRFQSTFVIRLLGLVVVLNRPLESRLSPSPRAGDRMRATPKSLWMKSVPSFRQ